MFEIELCHCACWSECEYSDKGRTPALYCALLMGCTSVPTLASTAILPLLNNVCSSGNAGCSPNGVPALEGWIGSSDACGRLMPEAAGRAVAYCP